MTKETKKKQDQKNVDSNRNQSPLLSKNSIPRRYRVDDV